MLQNSCFPPWEWGDGEGGGVMVEVGVDMPDGYQQAFKLYDLFFFFISPSEFMSLETEKRRRRRRRSAGGGGAVTL